jgi:hypothetical protein
MLVTNRVDELATAPEDAEEAEALDAFDEEVDEEAEALLPFDEEAEALPPFDEEAEALLPIDEEADVPLDDIEEEETEDNPALDAFDEETAELCAPLDTAEEMLLSILLELEKVPDVLHETKAVRIPIRKNE